MPKISQIDQVPCQAEVRILQKITHKNLHRVRHIEGVCEKFHKGTVRVGFWVGNCASGYKSADAYAGRNSVSRIYLE